MRASILYRKFKYSLKLMLLFLLSMIVRLLFFMKYPPFRMDELYENFWSYLIVSEKFIPLTNTAPFIGALYNYLAAFMYSIFHSIVAFRLLTVLAGALTAVILYFLALEITGNRVVSVFSSVILALAPPHILVASHVSWSASLTPLFIVLSVYVFLKAFKSEEAKWWIILGIVIALSIQSHPSTLASYAGLLLMFTYLYGFKTFLSKVNFKTLKLMILGFILGYINMVVYNTIYPLHSIEFVFEAEWTGLAGSLTLAEYFRRFSFIVVEFFSMLPSGIPIITLPYYIGKPLFYIFITALAVVIAISLRSRVGRALGVYVTVAMLFLAFGTKGTMTYNIFGFAWGPHYLQQIIPLFSVQLSTGLYGIISYCSKIKSISLRTVAKTLTLLLLIFTMILWPLLNMFTILSFMDSKGYTNDVFLNVIYGLKKHYRETPIYVMYNMPFKDHLLMLIHVIAEIEGLHVYPKFNLRVVHILREAAIRGNAEFGKEIAKVVEESNREFNEELRKAHSGVFIAHPGEAKKLLEALKHLNFTVTLRHIVRINSKPIYEIIVVKIE